jgi:hypothetical protein
MPKDQKETKKPYLLIEEKIPDLEKSIRTSEYDGLINDFIQSKAESSRLEYPDKNIRALQTIIRSRIKKNNLGIKIVTRKGKLYLTKKI